MTTLMAEGRRMMRLSRELAPEVFEALLAEFQRVVRDVLASMGAQIVDVDDDTVVASFPTTRHAALAALAAQRAVAAHQWPHGRSVEMSVGLDAGVGEPAASGCAALCDAAEGGQIFLAQAVSDLLETDDLGGAIVQDLGEVRLRRTEGTVRAYELLRP